MKPRPGLLILALGLAIGLLGCSDTPSQPALDLQPQFSSVPAPPGSTATWYFEGVVYALSPAGGHVEVGDPIQGSVTFTLEEVTEGDCYSGHVAHSSWTYTHNSVEYTTEGTGYAYPFTAACDVPQHVIIYSHEFNEIPDWQEYWTVKLYNYLDLYYFPLEPPELVDPGPDGPANIFHAMNYIDGKGFVAILTYIGVAPRNTAPIVHSIALPTEPMSVGATASISAVFTDEDLGDLHTATIDWGDGQASAGLVTEPTPTSDGGVTGGHAYSTPGVYTVTVTVAENMDPATDLSGTRSSDAEITNPYAVVFDPEGGFVTGGGWFESPEGAHIGTSLTGKASFGFVSKYKKGATIPTGNTQFQFKAGELSFHSESYDWLVVTGNDYARFKGAGTINGGMCPDGDLYRFHLWAGDGDPDTFRIKLWCEDQVTGDEDVIYDNGFDQAIDGGNIVIHRTK